MTEQQAWVIFVFEPLFFLTLTIFVIALWQHFRPYRDDTSRFKPPTQPEKKEKFKPPSKWHRSDDMLENGKHPSRNRKD